MPGVQREAVFGALFTLLSNAVLIGTNTPALAKSGRQFVDWAQVAQADKPYLILLEPGEYTQQTSEAVPGKRTWDFMAIIYTDAGINKSVPPISVLNPIVDAVEASIFPLPTFQNKQTLGGLVSHCWWEGKAVKVPGDFDGKGMAILPGKILVP